MSIRIVATALSAFAGIGTAAYAGSVATSAPAPVATQLTAATTPAAPAAPSTSTSCDDGRWHAGDGISVEGRPSFDAGDSGAAYVWHDSDGWHVRTTDAARGAHHYTGTISVSPGASFTAVRPVRNERDDHVFVSSDDVLHYDLTTFRGIDGFDFRVSACAHDRDHEALHFAMDYNGREQDVARIKLGEDKQHPDSASFVVVRDV